MSEETKDKAAEAAEKNDDNQTPESQEGGDKKNEATDGGNDAAAEKAAEKAEKTAAKEAKEVNVRKGSKTTVNRNVMHNGTYYEKDQVITTKNKDYKALDLQGYIGE